MRSITSAALLAAAAFAMLQAPAEAAPRKRTAYQPPRYIYYGREDRAPTRITVRRRSFLDPGSESKTFAQHYSNYFASPSYTIFRIISTTALRRDRGRACRFRVSMTFPGGTRASTLHALRATPAPVPRAQPDGRTRDCDSQLVSRANSVSTASPISAVLTAFSPAATMSAVRKPLASAAAIA